MTADASSLGPGSTIGSWTLVRKLGEGAMGVVFEARRAGVTAALKVVRPELFAKPDAAARFKREGKLLQRIDHRNCVRLLDVGEASGFPYLALGFIDGDSLAATLERGPLSPDEALRLAADLLRGLAAIHEAGILHRDMKPGNVLRAKDGDWKITDFGLARRETEESIVVTRPGAIVGTPYYMAPEQCLGEATDARSDLYSTGTTLYHAIAGEPPFKGKAVMDVIRAHVREPAPDLAATAPGTPPQLARLVAKLLAKQKEQRPESAKAALLLLGVGEMPGSGVLGADLLEPAPRFKPAAPAPAAASIGDAPTLAPVAPSPPASPAEMRARRRAELPPALAQARPLSNPGTTPAPAGSGTAKRLSLTPSGRVPGIIKAKEWRRGSRIPFERATLPLLPAFVGLVLYGISRVASREALFDDKIGLHAVKVWAILGGLVGLWRIFTGFFEVNAPPLAKTKWFYTRLFARLRVLALGKSSPRLAASALRDLGELNAAAEMLLAGGFLREAAQDFLRVGEGARAARIYEQLKDAEAAVKAYAKLGDSRAAQIAYDAKRYDEAARLFQQHGDFAQAAEAWQRAGEPVEAANAFEVAARLEDAGNELVRALENAEGALARSSSEDRHKVAVRAADLLGRGGAALTAAGRFEALGEPELAAQLFEQGGDLAEAARIVSGLGQHQKAADLYARAGRTVEAARERGEAMLRAGPTRRPDSAAELAATTTEEKEKLAHAARCFEAAGESGRAADLFARAGDLGSAARLYEKTGALREASLCLRQAGDLSGAARVLEKADPIGAAQTFADAGQHQEALRVLSAAAATPSPRRARAIALLGDVHLKAGHEADAVVAFEAALENATENDPDLVARVAHCIDKLASMGRLEHAIAHLASVKKRVGSSPELDGLMADLSVRKRTAQGGADLVGAVVDHYRVDALLGEGGTAWVYEAEHTFLGRTVALKVLKPHPTGGSDMAGRFYAEAHAVADLRHPNVIHVWDVGATPGGLLYMALELIPGPGLRAVLENEKRVAVARACRIISGVLAGLGVAHAKGIVHRDLKPENILLGANETPKVVDFGIAKVVASRVVTMTGTFLGTPKYASPEQAQGLEAAVASDIYACGLVLYEMLAGRSPFESQTPLGFLTKHASEAPAPVASFAGDLPAPLAAAIMKALEKDPTQRWVDAEAFRRAVAPYAALAPVEPTDMTRNETFAMPLQADRLRHAATSVDLDEQEPPAPEAKK